MELSHLNFETEQKEYQPQDYSHIPKDILKSNTVENLISQNEDLMSRLKVSLRRLSTLELDNQKISEEAQSARLSQSALGDQVSVLKEKDFLWKTKIDQYENERGVQAEKVKALQEQLQKTFADLERHQKYHERIRTQVKPYLSQLKEYSKAQEAKVQSLGKEITQRDTQLHDIRHQMMELTKNSRSQMAMQEKKTHEMTAFYEAQIEKMLGETRFFKGQVAELETKAVQLAKALERQDHLENELVEIHRSKEDMKTRLEKETLRLQERVNELTRHNQRLGIEHADLQVRVVDDTEKVQLLERQNSQMQEQLESLRYMWTAKNEECDKMKSAMQSLEKLNLELSQKINDLRQEAWQ
jgi:chromosome segregation ATPase